MGDLNSVVAVISQVGFPIAVATYCLYKLNATIAENTKMLNAIYTKITGEVSKSESKD